MQRKVLCVLRKVIKGFKTERLSVFLEIGGDVNIGIEDNPDYLAEMF